MLKQASSTRNYKTPKDDSFQFPIEVYKIKHEGDVILFHNDEPSRFELNDKVVEFLMLGLCSYKSRTQFTDILEKLENEYENFADMGTFFTDTELPNVERVSADVAADVSAHVADVSAHVAADVAADVSADVDE